MGERGPVLLFSRMAKSIPIGALEWPQLIFQGLAKVLCASNTVESAFFIEFYIWAKLLMARCARIRCRPPRAKDLPPASTRTPQLGSGSVFN